jgi:hypothetical protein
VKQKIEVGDLVTQPYRRREIGIGLVIDDDGSDKWGVATLRYKVYWFKPAQIIRGSRGGLTKLSPTQDKIK